MFDEVRRETVETGGHGRVGSEQIARPRHGQGHVEGLAGRLHESVGAFQNGKGGMPLVQMADFRLDAQRAQQPPSPDAQKHFLLETQLRPTAV